MKAGASHGRLTCSLAQAASLILAFAQYGKCGAQLTLWPAAAPGGWSSLEQPYLTVTDLTVYSASTRTMSKAWGEDDRTESLTCASHT